MYAGHLQGRHKAGVAQLAFAASLLACLVVLTALRADPAVTFGGTEAGAVTADGSYADLPIAFAPGPAGTEADFTASTAAGSISLSSRGAQITPAAKSAEPVFVSVHGAADAAPLALRKLPGVVNDLRGADSSEWRRNVPTYERIRYPDVLQGIAMDWHGTSGTLEYDFRVAPGADPSRIAVDFSGAPIRLAADGALVVGSGEHAIRQAAPIAFQRIDGQRVPVEASFELDGRRAGFEFGAYDRSRPLVIDPLMLTYSTLLASGSEYDYVHDVAIDAAGSAYLTGLTGTYSGPDPTPPFPLTAGAHDTTRNGQYDVFVTKLNAAGSDVVYSTLLGGDGGENGDGIAVDAAGNAYVTGMTNSGASFPTTAGAFTTATNDGYDDVFVTKLNPTGTALVYSSRFGGGRGNEESRAIALDSTGAAWITGYTASTNSPGCSGGPCTEFPTAGGGTGDPGDTFQRDMFVAKITPPGDALAFSTYLGGNSQDEAYDIDVDSSGRAYITGFTSSYEDMPYVNEYDTKSLGTYQTNGDAYIARFGSAGDLQYASAIGSTGQQPDVAYGVAADNDGNAYIGGAATSGTPGFDLKGQYEGYNGNCCYAQDAFLSKFDTDESGAASLVYSTLLGGGHTETINAVEVDSTGAAYVGGVTGSGVSANPTFDKNAYDFDVTPDRLAQNSGGSAFVTKFAPAGNTLAWSTTIPNGSSSPVHTIEGIAIDEASNSVYFAGTASGNSAGSYLTTPGAFQENTQPASQWDGFAGKLTFSTGPVDTTPPDTSITAGPFNGQTIADTTPTFSFSSTEANSTYRCRFDSQTYASCSNPFTPATPLTPGFHTFDVQAIDPSNNIDPSAASRSFTVSEPPADTTPPETSITSGPAQGGSTTNRRPAIAFSSNEAGSSFQCAYDGAAFAVCSSPHIPPGQLGFGPHTFRVRATDAAGNTDASPAARTFTVATPPPPPDTTPPNTTITQKPKATIKSKKLPVSVQFGFSSDEAGSTFTCKLDGGAAAPCNSPKSYDLGKGSHTFTVIARDRAGNADRTAATATVNVKKKKKKKKRKK